MSRAGVNVRRRRDACTGTIDLLERRTEVLELKEGLTDDDRQSALRMSGLLGSVTADFKKFHFTLVDSMEEEEDARAEQTALQDHELKVMDLVDRLGRLVAVPQKSKPMTALDLLRKRVDQVEKNFRMTKEEFDEHSHEMDIYALQDQEESIEDSKSELKKISRDLLSLEDVGDLEDKVTRLERLLRALKTDVKRSAGRKEEKPPLPTIGAMGMSGIQLPKIEVPTFDGNILNWRIFWEQFESTVHTKSQLTDSDKLTYLRDALKDSPARFVVSGLTQTAESYGEAIKCLQERYDRPRILHLAHVRKIQEATPLKSGSGPELRRLHDLLVQHIRALKALEQDTLDTYLTAAIELKLDEGTKLKWTEYSSNRETTPPYEELLKFLDIQARHHESVMQVVRKAPAGTDKRYASRTNYAATPENMCIACKKEMHQLHNCGAFQRMSREERWEVIKKNGYCMNCLKGGHMASKCRAPPFCRKCKKTHHTLLHVEKTEPARETTPVETVSSATYIPPQKRSKLVLLMTCRAQITGPDGVSTQARVFLDPGAACSFVTERLAQQLRLPRRKNNTMIAGIAGVSTTRARGAVSFTVGHVRGGGKKIHVNDAFVLSRVTTDMPTSQVGSIHKWKHLAGLDLSDPEFGTPARVDVLLGADYYGEVLLHGRRWGPKGTPYAQKTCLGWVLAGPLSSEAPKPTAYTCFVATENDSLRKFWEIEDYNLNTPVLSIEEKSVVRHFDTSHSIDENGRFIVPLPRKTGVIQLGESRKQALERFSRLERSLRQKGIFQEFADAIREYFKLEHAEPVPAESLGHECAEVYYLPMHAVRKDSSSTTKIRVVFDASAKTTTGTSLNDHLLVGPTVHSSLVDVLLRFRQHKVALTTDVSRMYRAVLLSPEQRDLHRFVWREDPDQPVKDYRMTRLTFGVAASSFAANMALKQNAINHKERHPKAYQAVIGSFYVDDGLTGADSVDEAIKLRKELQELFGLGGFTLRKWKSSDRDVLSSIPGELIDPMTTQEIILENDYTKVLGVEWNAVMDCFRPLIALPKLQTTLTKRVLVSNIARLFDVLGWCSPAIILMKILLQRLWENNLEWDEPVPTPIERTWKRWHRELPELRDHRIMRPYFPREIKVVSKELHGFCDASEAAYSGVIYFRAIDTKGDVHVSLVMAKTKVAPLKRLSIPRLELCSAVLLSKLISHVAGTLDMSSQNIYAWTDSQVVLGWLQGNPRRFKPFVGNRVAELSEVMPIGCWHHVPGTDNPADCASRGMFPSQLAQFELWWYGPRWLRNNVKGWGPPSSKMEFPEHPIPSEERELPELVFIAQPTDLSLIERTSSYDRLIRITAWILRFVRHCRKRDERISHSTLAVHELNHAEEFWCRTIQSLTFQGDITNLKKKGALVQTSKLLKFHPFLDPKGLLRAGGRISHANLPYTKRHPILLPGNHVFTELLITSEHKRLLHAGATLVSASLSRRFCILNSRRAIRSIVQKCVKCRKVAARPKPQIFGQLPADRVKPGPVFDCVGIDYAGPLLIKSGPIRKPVLKKSYVAVFVCFATKAVHLELVSELTTTAFIATLRRFIGRRGIPRTIWSDHGSNFIGAEREIQQLLREGGSKQVADFCASQKVNWSFSPEHAPHFGGLWEAAVKSFKTHVKAVLGEVKLNFEEFSTVLVQVEACLNSRPLTPLPDQPDALEVLTPGHFLIGRPLTALPDEVSHEKVTNLRRWQLCQALVRHLWARWSSEYLQSLWRVSKWHNPAKNLKVGDIVCLREEPLAPTKWPLARILQVHPGKDGKVRVITVRTAKGVYRRPVVKVVPLVCPD